MGAFQDESPGTPALQDADISSTLSGLRPEPTSVLMKPPSDPAPDLSGSGAVRPEHRFDEPRLAAWMVGHVEDFCGPLTVEKFNGGQSNPTFKLITPRQTYVMRRKAAGLIIKSAHAVDREHRVIRALYDAGYPVPRTYGLCTDDSIIGSWFYVMDCVEGRIFWDSRFPDVPRDQRPLYFDAMNETLARLHCLDPAALGLDDFGRQGAYVERQIARFSRQYLEDPDAGRCAEMDALLTWLPAHLPQEDARCLVHGDYKSDNMLFHPTEPRVIAVLDWELSTLGDPLADFAYNAMFYRAPRDADDALTDAVIAQMNIPSEADYIAAYCRRTGRAGIPSFGYYVAFNMFRLAAILHGIQGRFLRGTASSANASAHGDRFTALAKGAWAQAQLYAP